MIEVADSNATYYYHFHGLGSCIALTDADANTVQLYECSVYGRVAASDPNHTNPFMFTGRRFDADTGLYYYRARYYNPYIGRFLQTDPIGYTNGINWYLYCANNPVVYVDPFGLDWFEGFANFCAGAADSLSFGGTALVRKALPGRVDAAVVDYQSAAYIAGEWTEVGVEVAVTLGSATMKYAAKKAAKEAAEVAGKSTVSAGQKIVRRRGAKYLPEISEVIKHHANPLFGHPGSPIETIFPTGGLPPEIFSGGWNIELVADQAAHMAAHAKLQLLEKWLRVAFNPGMTAARGARNYFADSDYLDLLIERLSEGYYMTDGDSAK